MECYLKKKEKKKDLLRLYWP